jgi:hypothetical protein
MALARAAGLAEVLLTQAWQLTQDAIRLGEATSGIVWQRAQSAF